MRNGVYLRDEQQSQRHGDGQVGVGEKQQQHPVRVKLGNQGESVSAQSRSRDEKKEEEAEEKLISVKVWCKNSCSFVAAAPKLRSQQTQKRVEFIKP